MTAHLMKDDRSPTLALEELVARHGLVRVALSLAALWARRTRPPALRDHDLPDRLRRDIGLECLPERTRYWEL